MTLLESKCFQTGAPERSFLGVPLKFIDVLGHTFLPPPQTSSSSRTQLSALPQDHPSLLPQYTTVNFQLYVDCMHPKHVLNASSIPRVLHNTTDAAVERVTVSNSSLKLLKSAFFVVVFLIICTDNSPSHLKTNINSYQNVLKCKLLKLCYFGK